MSDFWNFYFKNIVYPTKENDPLLISLKNIKKNKMQTIKNLMEDVAIRTITKKQTFTTRKKT
jgi:hypothetical protein